MDWRFERCADRLLEIMSRVTRADAPSGGVRRQVATPDPADVPTTSASTRSTSVTCTPSWCAPRGRLPRCCGRRGRPSWRCPRSGSRCSAARSSTPSAPVSSLALAAGRRNAAISCQSPYEAFGTLVLAALLPPRLRPPVQVELHGDWRTASRLYGSRKRRLMARATDRVAEWTLRRADRVRPGEPGARRPGTRPRDTPGRSTAMSRSVTTARSWTRRWRRSRSRPRALFVGVLEAYKALDVLLDAWPSVLRGCPTPG